MKTVEIDWMNEMGKWKENEFTNGKKEKECNKKLTKYDK